MSAVNLNMALETVMCSDIMKNRILPNLALDDWSVLSRACAVWKTMIQPLLLDEVIFGKDKWKKIPGVQDVGDEPVLSIDQLKAILGMKCPFFNEPDLTMAHRFQDGKTRKVWQTHMLILFPEKINGEPCTVNSVGKIFRFEKEGDIKSVYELIPGDDDAEFRNKQAPKSYFALVTRDLVPRSRGEKYEIKENLLKNKGYRVSNPNEAITSIVIMNLGPSEAKKGYFFGREGEYWTYTTTTEKDGDWPLIVGAAARSGLCVYRDDGDYDDVGALGCSEVL
jgi:hypothetical protein